MPSIKLQSSDGENFSVDVAIAKKSVTIRTMLEDLGMDLENDSEEAVPLPNVTGAVLKKVLEWATEHKDDKIKKVNPEDSITWYKLDKFDADFFKGMDKQMLFDIILAANYLEIQDLLDLGTKTVADSLRDKTPEQIRKQFGIVCDFTDEELAQVRKENEWADEK